MNKLSVVSVILCLATQALANWYSTEDESRFRSQPYAKAEPGMLTPAAYIERAKKALRARYSDIRLGTYDAPRLTRRHYATLRQRIATSYVLSSLIKN